MSAWEGEALAGLGGGPAPAAPLLPPRPNLGPEPWPESDRAGGWLIGVAVAVVLLLAVLVAWRGRCRRRVRRGPGPSPRIEGVEATGGDRRVARGEALREALIAAFGPSWGAKTTEEIAAEPGLAARLGGDRAAVAVAVLAEADRAKFSGVPAAEIPPDAEADRAVAELIAALRAGRPAPIGAGRPGPSRGGGPGVVGVTR